MILTADFGDSMLNTALENHWKIVYNFFGKIAAINWIISKKIAC